MVDRELTKIVGRARILLMLPIASWVKQNKLVVLLLVVVAYLLFGKPLFPETAEMGLSAPDGSQMVKSILPPPADYAPAPEVEDRLVIQESSFSLVVENVAQVQKTINQKVESLGGYMVNSHLTHPEETQAASGRITVRVPQAKLDEALGYFRNLAVKVVSENLIGRDVTDEYVDIEARLATLTRAKVKFEQILEKAEKVDDILRVQRELINLQRQIDSLKGQQQYLEKNAQLSKVTVYLATDELSLPYAPTEAWRPKVVFKKAVRSLVSTGRKAGSVIIWLLVYAVIWLPVLAVYLILRRRQKQNN